MKKYMLCGVAFLILIALGVFGYKKYQVYEPKSDAFTNEEGITYASRIEKQNYQIHSEDKWKDVTIKGINLGVAEPGSFPGDVSIDKATYLRWFQYISKMNANTIRVYTLQNTDFYEAFYEFNRNNSNPLYLIHGVWLNEAAIAEYKDAFHRVVYDGYMEDSIQIINAIHGNADVAPKKGSASGKYTKDVSQYVIGWILGIEFEAEFVHTTNENNAEKTSFEGEYLYTEEASPFEVFLAETGDQIISYEVENYGMQRPTAFSNWLTTDPLEHPNEPGPETEDSAVIEVEHIKSTDRFLPGMFASYHIYPYYPDFLNYDTKYTQGENVNTYKAYLEELTKHHSMPVMVAEFGLPSSRGIAHKSIYSGFNQGYLTEEQQGEYLSSMIDDILDTDCLGFLVFSWQDEWFKRSWNTMDLENAEKRPYWLNVQTGEENFGLLAFDAGEKDTQRYVDGNYEEWTKEDILVTNDGYTLSVQEDSTYLYLLVETKDFDFEKDTLYIPVDTIQNQGNHKYEGYSFDQECDFLIRINGRNNSEVLVDSYYDVFYYQYAMLHNFINKTDYDTEKDADLFGPILLALNRQLNLPETKEQIEFESVNTGKLKYGIANPKEENFDSLADFYAKDGKIELRIPWGLLSFSDPSSREILDNYYAGEPGITFTKIDTISFGLAAGEKEEVPFAEYKLSGWDQVSYHERLKQSYYILQQKYKNIR